MEIKFIPEDDTVFIKLKAGHSSTTKVLDERCSLGVDDSGDIVWATLFDVSDGVNLDILPSGLMEEVRNCLLQHNIWELPQCPQNLDWEFPENRNRKKVGYNNQGAAHFTGASFRNVIRETTQNSLDAVANKGAPVTIQIRKEDLDVDLVGGSDLLAHIKACVQTSKVSNDKQPLLALESYMKDAIQKHSLPTLKISEANTTGASDVPHEDGTSMWEALTNAEGVDVKATADSAGRHGIGKNAPYTVSIPRMVLYSTTYEDNNGETKSLFIGRCMLVSHEYGGIGYSHEGYLGAPDFMPLGDEAIHAKFRRRNPGLDLYIVGFDVHDDTDWRPLAAAAAITNFFHSINNGKVVFDIDGLTIDQNTIMDIAEEQGEEDLLTGETLRFLSVSSQEPDATTILEGIGQVNLYLRVYEDRERTERDIAIVRDSGMLITSELSRMNLPRMRRERSFSRNLKGFTAIIECLSQGKPSLLRDAESTSHDEISTGHILDPGRRRQADRQIRRLADWVKDQISTKTYRELTHASDEANELNKYVSLVGQRNQTEGKGTQRTDITITTPREIVSGLAPPSRVRSRGNASVIVPSDSPGGQPRGGPGKSRRRSGRRRNYSSQRREHSFARLRMMPNGIGNTHSLIAVFDAPRGELKNVKLVTVGEDGSEKVMGLRPQVKINGKQVTTKNDAVRSIKPTSGAERVVMEIHTREPILDDGQLLKGFYLRAEGTAE